MIKIDRTVRDADFTTDWAKVEEQQRTKVNSGLSVQQKPPPRMALEDQSTQDHIRQRAYEIYLRRGAVPGHPEKDWAQAEGEILHTKGR